MKASIPEIIERIGFDFHWSEEKVWALKVPVTQMDMKELEWHFDLPFWNYNKVPYGLSPRQVFKDKNKFSEEYDRIIQSDLKHPLDIMLWRGRWLLLDGLHRLAKAKLLGYEKVMVRKIPEESIPLITR